MDRNIYSSLKKLKKTLYDKGWFSDNFYGRVLKKLEKGDLTYANIVSVLDFINDKYEGKFEDVILDFKQYMNRITIDEDIDSVERHRQYKTVANYSAKLADMIFLDLTDMASKDLYDKAMNDCFEFIDLVEGFKDDKLKCDLTELKYVFEKRVQDLKQEEDHKFGFKRLEFQKLMEMDPYQLMNHAQDVQRAIHANIENDDLFEYLAKVILATNKGLSNVKEDTIFKVTVKNTLIKFSRSERVISGKINFEGKLVDFEFNL